MLRTRATFIYTRPIRRRSDPNNSRNEDSSRTFGNFGREELAAIHLFLFLFATTNVSQDYLIGGPIGGARLRLTWRLTKSLAIICIARSPLAIVQPRIPTSRLDTTVHGLNSLFLPPNRRCDVVSLLYRLCTRKHKFRIEQRAANRRGGGRKSEREMGYFCGRVRLRISFSGPLEVGKWLQRG